MCQVTSHEARPGACELDVSTAATARQTVGALCAGIRRVGSSEYGVRMHVSPTTKAQLETADGPARVRSTTVDRHDTAATILRVVTLGDS
eukprot:3617338-Prymnesium_polylepis.1